MTNQVISLNTETGCLNGVLFLPSPHQDERPAGTAIDLLVIHSISLPPGEFGGQAIPDFFMGQLKIADHPYFAEIQSLRVSAHLLIRRTGEIIQFVPFHRRAWHAGESNFQGRARCNDYSIGIELEGVDTLPYEAVQYQQLAAVTHLLMQAYPGLTRERMVGHSDIAPGRKTDPGEAFHWHHFIGQLT